MTDDYVQGVTIVDYKPGVPHIHLYRGSQREDYVLDVTHNMEVDGGNILLAAWIPDPESDNVIKKVAEELLETTLNQN